MTNRLLWRNVICNFIALRCPCILFFCLFKERKRWKYSKYPMKYCTIKMVGFVYCLFLFFATAVINACTRRPGWLVCTAWQPLLLCVFFMGNCWLKITAMDFNVLRCGFMMLLDALLNVIAMVNCIAAFNGFVTNQFGLGEKNRRDRKLNRLVSAGSTVAKP